MSAEPPSQQLSDIKRAALAGTAEYLCHRFGYEVPLWTEGPEFFLEIERNWFEDWETSGQEGRILQELFDPQFIGSIRECSLKSSAGEFIPRNLLLSPTRRERRIGRAGRNKVAVADREPEPLCTATMAAWAPQAK
jgi:hypothetical protein